MLFELRRTVSYKKPGLRAKCRPVNFKVLHGAVLQRLKLTLIFRQQFY